MKKIRSLMKTHQLDKVFVATDAIRKEQEELRKLLPEMVRFEPTWEELELYKDGGVAIIDQWICAHARCLGPRCSQRSPLPQYSAARAGGCGRPLSLSPFRKFHCFPLCCTPVPHHPSERGELPGLLGLLGVFVLLK